MSEKFTYTDSKGTYLPNDIKDELRFSMGVSKYKHTHAVCEGALERIKNLERQLAEAREKLKDYKYDLKTLVSVVSECLNKMSSEECYDTLQQVADHYKQLKEKGDEN